MRLANDMHQEVIANSSSSFRSSASSADIQSTCGTGGVSANNNTDHHQLHRTISAEILGAIQIDIEAEQRQQQQYSSNEHLNYDQQAAAKAFQRHQQGDYPMATCNQSAGNPTTGTNGANGSANNTNTTGNNGNLGSDEHLMEINYTDEPAHEHPQQQGCLRRNDSSHLMDLIKDEQRQHANCCGGAASMEHPHNNLDTCQPVGRGRPTGAPNATTGSNCTTIVSSDYNSDDQEFYLPPNAAGARYIAADAQSDDLLYHDEVSDHNDCCSDHYDQTGTGRSELAGASHDYRGTELANDAATSGGGGANGGASACYMDEYEYENISTIRHYPLPMPAQMAPSFPLPATGLTGDQQPSARDGADSAGAYGRTGQPQQACQQQLDQSAGFLPSAAGLGTSSHATQLAPDYQQQPQQQQQVTSECSALIGLHDHEQTIEHADHEEHNLLHNALMRSPEKLKLIDSIITLLNYASNYNQKMLSPLLEIKRCIERDLEVVLSDTTSHHQQCCAAANSAESQASSRQQQQRDLQALVAARQRQVQPNQAVQQQRQLQQRQIAGQATTTTTSAIPSAPSHQTIGGQQVSSKPQAAQCTEMIVSEIEC